jgi:hypothetical protein
MCEVTPMDESLEVEYGTGNNKTVKEWVPRLSINK